MKFDQLDVFILREMFNAYKNDKIITTWEMAKKYIKSSDKWQVTKVCLKIKQRLNFYSNTSFILKTRNGKKYQYILNLDKLTFIKRKIEGKYREGIWISI